MNYGIAIKVSRESSLFWRKEWQIYIAICYTNQFIELKLFKFYSRSKFCCRSVYLFLSDVLYFSLCIAVRIFAGCGTAMLAISSTSVLLKCTSYETSTVMVSSSKSRVYKYVV